jgi:lysophospholipase L1-like esterase
VSPPDRLARWLATTSAAVRALALAGLPALCAAQGVASFPPDSAGIVYSDYACAHVGPERAGFERKLVDAWVCQHEQMSPGVRATFLVDASQMKLELDYRSVGFFCGLGEALPLSWEFGLVVDGVRRPTGARNPLYPLVDGCTPWVHLGSEPGPHQVTVVWPSGADVDLVRLHLRETRDASVPELLDLPPRTQPLLAVFGDSIAQGLSASHVLNTFPVRLGARLDWRVVNLGFVGRTTHPSDAWLAAGMSSCKDGQGFVPDLLLLAIGSNDFHFLGGVHTGLRRFEERYPQWLRQFRSLRPTTPILCLTPLPRGDECGITTRTMEEYRERIRLAVEAASDPRIHLFEGRDLIAFPPSAGDPLFDAILIHPTDLGAEQIAERLSRFNLVRNASFELKPLQGCGEVAEPEPYLWTDVGTGISAVSDRPGGNRVLALSASGARTQLVHGLSDGDRFQLKAAGLLSVAGQAGRVTLEFLDAFGGAVGAPLVLSFSQSSWRRLTRQGTAPAGAVRGRLTLSKSPGPGQFLADELELTLGGF